MAKKEKLESWEEKEQEEEEEQEEIQYQKIRIENPIQLGIQLGFGIFLFSIIATVILFLLFGTMFVGLLVA